MALTEIDLNVQAKDGTLIPSKISTNVADNFTFPNNVIATGQLKTPSIADLSSVLVVDVANRLLKDSAGVISIDWLNRILKASDGSASLNFNTPGTVDINTILDMTGNSIIHVATPVNTTDAANKTYVDTVAQGLSTKASCAAATTAALVPVTPAGSGVGKTLTENANGLLSVDGVSTWVDVVNDGGSTNPAATNPASRVLVKNQANPVDNGIYCVTNKGSASAAFVLTRAIDFDGSPANEVAPGDFTFVGAGTVNASSGWTVSGTNNPVVVDTNPIPFIQFSGAGQIIAGNGLTKTGNELDVHPADASLIVHVGDIAVLRDPAGAIGLSGAGVAVNVDGTYIGISANALTLLNPTQHTVAGSNTQIQFNNSGSFGASPSLTWDGTNLNIGSAFISSANGAISFDGGAINSDGSGDLTSTTISASSASFAGGNVTISNVGTQLLATTFGTPLSSVTIEIHHGSAIFFDDATHNAPSNAIKLQGPTTIASQFALTLPSVQGSANSVLENDGSGNLSFGTTLKDSSGGVTVDFQNKTLGDQTNSPTHQFTVNWSSMFLADRTTGNTSLNWFSRLLLDSAGAQNLSWNTPGVIAVTNQLTAALVTTNNISGTGSGPLSISTPTVNSNATSLNISAGGVESGVFTAGILSLAGGAGVGGGLGASLTLKGWIGFPYGNADAILSSGGLSSNGGNVIFQYAGTEIARMTSSLNMGIGNASPDASAVLDLTSTTRGLLPPRMTTTQKNAIATPATGLIVYDTTLNLLQEWNGTSWGSVSASPITVTSVTTATVLTTSTTQAQIVLADATSASFSVTLPTAATANQQVTVKKIDSGANTVTIQANGSELIDGSNTQSLIAQWQTLTMISNGTSWFVI